MNKNDLSSKIKLINAYNIGNVLSNWSPINSQEQLDQFCSWVQDNSESNKAEPRRVQDLQKVDLKLDSRLGPVILI